MDEAAAGPFPGKLNINTCPAEVLQYLPGMDPGLADSIIFEREARTGGFTSIVDLLAVPAMSRNTLAGLASLIDVRSNVYTVTSRGRDAATGLEVEISATVDRSSLPVVIKDPAAPSAAHPGASSRCTDRAGRGASWRPIAAAAVGGM